MAKQYDFSDFDEPSTEPSQSKGYDFSDFDEPETAPDYSNQEVSQPEAFGVGAITGSTFGTAPIASGVGGFLANAAEQIGDKLGLTTDSQLSEGVNTDDLPGLTPELRAKLSDKTAAFTMPEKKTGLDALMSEYYDSRERMKGLQEASAEQHPWTNLAGTVVGGLPAAGATGVKLASTAGTAAKMAAGAKEGAALGAITGFGSGDAKLAEGEIYDTIRDTADSAVGGALIGGAIPAGVALGKGIAGTFTDLPIVQQIKTAFKGGKAGIKLNEESADQAIKTYSSDLLTAIQEQFKAAGRTKANALDYADEIGVRVNAGEEVQEIIDDMVQRGAVPDDIAEKSKFLDLLTYLKNGPEDKLANKLQTARARSIDKMEQKGFTLLDESTNNSHVQDFIPESDANTAIGTAKQTFQKIDEGTDLLDDALGEAGEEISKPVIKIVQQAQKVLGLDLRKYNLKDLSLRDTEEIIGQINKYSGINNPKGPVTPLEKMAGGLAADLRSLSELALEEAGKKSGNASLHKTLAATSRAGIKGNVLAQGQVAKDKMIDKLKDVTKSSNTNSDKQRVFQYLEEASPEYAKRGFKQEAEFLSDFNSLAQQVKPLNSSNAAGVLGSAKNIGLSVSNKAGSIYGGLTRLTEVPVERLSQMAQQMSTSTNKAAQQYAPVLVKASQAVDERKRSAILYGLYQQPAFRELYQSMGEGANDIILPVGTDRESEN